MDDRLFEKLQDIESLLAHAHHADHYCGADDCTIDNPKCLDMHTKAAFARLREILEPRHEGAHQSRLARNDAERIYVGEWKKANQRVPGVNDGFTLIEWILCPETKRTPSRVSERDAQVAADVIQWIGTACGLAFVRRCEQRIAEARAIRREWDSGFVSVSKTDNETPERAAATLLAARVLGHPEHGRLVLEIEDALRFARGGDISRRMAEIAALITKPGDLEESSDVV